MGGQRSEEQADLMGTSRIVCVRHAETTGEQLLTMRPDGGDLRGLTGGPGQGDNWCPAWSPDGARICFTSNRTGRAALWLMASDGSDQRQLTGTGPGEDYEPSWSPDGAAIVFARGDHQADDLWLVDVTSGEARPLTTEQRLDCCPAWSPDGHQIVFTRTLASPSGLYIVPAEGGDPRFLAPGAHPSWAPNAEHIAWAHGASLWVLGMAAKGTPTGRARPLVCAAEMLVRASSWSPDGSAVVFEAQLTDAAGARERLMLVDAGGGEPRDLGPGYQPSWSPWLHQGAQEGRHV